MPAPTPGDDVVKLRLGNDEVKIATSYEVKLGIFDQPCGFGLRLGDNKTVAQLIKKYFPEAFRIDVTQPAPQRTPFQLFINEAPQFSGFLHGFDAGGAGGATEVAFHGMDVLGELHLAEIEKDDSFTAQTYQQLVQLAMSKVSLTKPFSSGAPAILSTNDDNRKRVTGLHAPFVTQPTNAATLLTQAAGLRAAEYPILRLQAGEKLLDLVRRHLDSVGLFMWSSCDGDVIVGRPSSQQSPIAQLVRRRGSRGSNITEASWNVDHTRRYSEVVIYGKTSGRKAGRQTVKGAEVDQDFISKGYNRPRVITHKEVTSISHGEHIAQVVLAQGRRSAWRLNYTVAGHSTLGLTGQKIVWAPDTIVEVHDDEYGIEGTFWVDSVEHRRGPQTTTTVHLINTTDLVFGDGDNA